MSDLYRVVYASKNLLHGSEAEKSVAITQILEASQRNNEAADVTGALMFNGGAFAQVLEGPRQGVEDTFERIQRDMRHGDVTVLQCTPVEHRGFRNWSMAFVGQSNHGQTLWSSLAAASEFDLSRLEGDEVFAMLHGLVLEEENVDGSAAKLDHGPTAGPVDVAQQTRNELKDLRLANRMQATAVMPSPERGTIQAGKARMALRTQRSANDHMRSSKAALTILRAALASERQWTTELRHELDDARAALAEATDRVGMLLGERDLWAARARLLATMICEEADEIGEAARQAGPELPGARSDHSLAASSDRCPLDVAA